MGGQAPSFVRGLSVIYPASLGTSAICRWNGAVLRCRRVKTVSCLNATSEFCQQVTHFCGIVREELMICWGELQELPISFNAAQSFAEDLMLCPTPDAARSCIRKAIPGALSFLFAVQGIQQRMEKGQSPLASQTPECQTPFFLLACGVQDYLASVAAANLA